MPYSHAPTIFLLFFFNDTATTEIYTLSLHDALPISPPSEISQITQRTGGFSPPKLTVAARRLKCRTLLRPSRCRASIDRKSTRLNSSHQIISYAVFCLKKKQYYHQLNLGHVTVETRS